jgi:hypothetical protein
MTSMKYKLSAVVLEDIETSLNRIECSEVVISIEFPYQKALATTKKLEVHLKNFYLFHPTLDRKQRACPLHFKRIRYYKQAFTDQILEFRESHMIWSCGESHFRFSELNGRMLTTQ